MGLFRPSIQAAPPLVRLRDRHAGDIGAAQFELVRAESILQWHRRPERRTAQTIAFVERCHRVLSGTGQEGVRQVRTTGWHEPQRALHGLRSGSPVIVAGDFDRALRRIAGSSM